MTSRIRYGTRGSRVRAEGAGSQLPISRRGSPRLVATATEEIRRRRAESLVAEHGPVCVSAEAVSSIRPFRGTEIVRGGDR